MIMYCRLKAKVFHVPRNDPEMYFMKCSERKVSQCILALK